jgi:hypothetical protein
MHDSRDLTVLTSFALRVSDGFEADGADDEDTPALTALLPMFARRAPALTTLVLLAACATLLQLAALAAACWPTLRVLVFGDVAALLLAHPALRARDLSSRWGVLTGELVVLPVLRALAGPVALAAALPGAVGAAPRARARRVAGLRDAPPLTLAGLEIAVLVAARELDGLRLQGQCSPDAIIDSGVLTSSPRSPISSPRHHDLFPLSAVP